MKENLETIDEIVRDFTSVVPRSKSEIRTRIEELLVAQRAELAEKIKGMKKIRKPTHGTCCTCQTCGDSNDYECQCPRNAVLDEVVAVLAL